MLSSFKNNLRPTIVGLLFFFTILLLHACDSNKTTISEPQTTEAVKGLEATLEEISKVQLEIDTISFTIDERSDGYTNSLQYIEDGRPTLSLYNKDAHSIDLYDFHKREMYERIPLAKEGPNGVGSAPVGIWFLSPDSIVVTNKFDLFLVNRQAKVLNKFRLNMSELGSFPDIILSTTHPVIRKGNKIIASIYPQKDVFKSSDLRKWKNFVEFDLVSGEMRAFGDLPDLMQERILGFNYVDKSYVFNGEDIIISFYPSKDLYKMSYPFDESLKKIEIDNPNFKDVEEMANKRSSDFMSYTKHYLLNNSFDGIYFNGTHYLRINQKAISEEELNKRDWSKWKVIQVFDKNFNLILEKDLKSKYGNYQMTIPFRNSFLIAIGRDSEDVMNFAKITIKQ